MPCLCQVLCGNLFYEEVLPCFMVSVLRVVRVLGPQNLKQSENYKNVVTFIEWILVEIRGCLGGFLR